MRILVFIPARGGSKGIPKKNLVPVKGRPLIEYTLNTCRELFSYGDYEWVPLVSTDSEEIARYCESQGYDMTYRRPAKYAQDDSRVVDAVNDALLWIRDYKNILADAVLLLQPTTPIRNSVDIINAIRLVQSRVQFSAVSVVKMREHPNECIEINPFGWSYLLNKGKRPVRRQDYDQKFYFIDGSFYFASVSFIQENDAFVVEGQTTPYPLSISWPIDIDEVDDLKVAEAFI